MDENLRGSFCLLLHAYLAMALYCFTTTEAIAQAIDYDDLLEQLQNQKQRLMLPVVADGKTYGELSATLLGDQLQSLDAQTFIRALPFNDKTAKQLLQVVKGAKKKSDVANPRAPETITMLSPQQLAPLNIRVTYDPIALQLVVFIPLERLAVQQLSQQGATLTRGPQPATDAPSFFLNARYGYQQQQTNQPNPLANGSSLSTKDNQHALDLESALTVNNWTLESAGQWQKTDSELNAEAKLTPAWRRSYTRLIHDSVGQGTRITLGDLSYSTQGFQRFNAAAGIGYTSNRQLNSFRVGRETGGESFFIADNSKVDVYVNNRLVRSLYLTRGNYEVRDLPGVSGVNDVRLRVSNVQGETTEFNYSFVFNQQLLLSGEHDFSYNLGALRNFRQTGSSYGDKPMLSMHHNYGFSSTLTAGINLQAIEDHYLPGFGLQWATLAGSFSAEYAASFKPNSSAAKASLLQYRFETPKLGQLNVSWQFYEPNFDTPSAPRAELTSSTNNSRKSQALVHFGRAIGSRFVFNASFRTSTSRAQAQANKSWEIGFATRIFNRLRINATATRNNIAGQWQDTGFRLDLNWHSFQPQQFYNAQYESLNDTYRANYSGNHAYQQHNMATQIHYQQNQTQQPGMHTDPKYSRRGAVARYENHRLESSISLEETSAPQGHAKIARYSAGAALVMAGNRWAMSKPVNGSFIVVDTDINLADKNIGVNPRTGGGYGSIISGFSPAVISGVSPYFANHLIIDGQGTDLDYQSHNQNIESISGYRAGTLVNLKSDNKKVVEGRILNHGEPVAFIAGEATSHQTDIKYLFFTDDSGQFLLENLSPGTYHLSLLGNDSDIATITVPAKGQKRIQLEAIHID